MTVSKQTQAIVWAETGKLQPADGKPDTLQRLYAVVGKMVMQAVDGGTTSSMARPVQLLPLDAATMVATLDSVADNTYAGLALPRYAVLWEVASNGAPVTTIDLPQSSEWINGNTVLRTADFGDGTKRFRLYETDVSPGPNTPAYVSSLTGTGLSAAAQKTKSVLPPAFTALALGIFASVLFLYMAGVTLWTGRTVAQAHQLMLGGLPRYTNAFIDDLQAACVNAPKNSRSCEDGTFTAPPAPPPAPAAPAAAPALPAQAAAPAPAATPIKPDYKKMIEGAKTCTAQRKDAQQKPIPIEFPGFCLTAWQTALDFANNKTDLEGVKSVLFMPFKWNADVAAETGSVSFAWPAALIMLGILLLGIALGIATKHHIFGIWINEQNRISLARAQVSTWTVIALGGYTALVMFNAGMVAGEMRDFALILKSVTGLSPFPSIPTAVALALGISAGSTMLSAVILNQKPDANAVQLGLAGADDKSTSVSRFLGGNTSGLTARADAAQASLVDLFLGEEDANKDIVDISRLQNVIITVSLAGAYAALLFGFVQDIDFETVFRAFQENKPLLAQLPEAGASFASLLGLSHAAYLITKAAPKPSTGQ